MKRLKLVQHVIRNFFSRRHLIHFTNRKKSTRKMRNFHPGAIAYEQTKRNPLVFLKSLEYGQSPGNNKYAAMFKRNFMQYREQLAIFLFDFITSYMNLNAGDANAIEWGQRLGATTYAISYLKSRKIKLNRKLLVTPTLLRDTIFHEIAHFVVWKTDPEDMDHSAAFKKGCSYIEAIFPNLSIQWEDDPYHIEMI